jgi:dolichyl-phosphate-mannose--protein O-mannosyl transferase
MFVDEGYYMGRAMHVLEGKGPQEESYFYDHPYFGQLFLAGVFTLIDYPSSLNPTPNSNEVHSIEMLYIVPRVLMGLLAVIDTFLVYNIAQRLYNRKVAFIASIFLLSCQ